MKSWSLIRKKLEQEFLAESLNGHIKYFATRYRDGHDEEGRASIIFDGKEIIKGCFLKWEENRFDIEENCNTLAVELNAFDQIDFYYSYYIYENQSIEESLQSKNMLVKILAILDRRVGKRTLLKLQEDIENEPEFIQEVFHIRAYAEGII
ncbi:MAG: hypothetical protein K2O22_01395 [Anaeroplasmataceae bacterium]|nr:hypothetical protein [Anaeroplasmataceae bacterium]